MGFSDNDNVVGTVGRLDYQKNPKIFVEIANKYSKIDSEAKFLWIGKGSYKKDMEKHIAKLGLSDRFILTGYIENVEPYFSVFDTFVITSRYEGLPITIFKALSCEIPVVGFCVNGINDLSKQFKSVYGVEPLMVEEFVKKLADAKKMKKSKSAIIKKETDYVRENFNLNKMYDYILDVYDCF